jgi:hypothetical protein
MTIKHAALGAGLLLLATGSAFSQTEPGAPGTDQVIPEKQSAPISKDQPSSEIRSGRSLSQKLDASDGVIKPQMGIDPGMDAAAPVPNPNSTTVIKPPGTPGGAPGPEAK